MYEIITMAMIVKEVKAKMQIPAIMTIHFIENENPIFDWGVVIKLSFTWIWKAEENDGCVEEGKEE